MRKRDRQRFVRLCNELIARLGGVRSDGIYQWELATRYGRLDLTVRENRFEGPGTVFTSFDDPSTAGSHLDCNPYSGKWNYHYAESHAIEVVLLDLGYWFDQLMNWEPTS